jgi:DNA-binding response OmpR family regulator
MTVTTILLVDDNDDVRNVLQESLESKDFEVVPAASVTQALNLIVTRHFDVLITDLHMPDPGDGFAVVTAMRHAQPEALTLVVSGFPDVQEAMAAILLHADQILVKPFKISELAEFIRRKTTDSKPFPRPSKESIASILERDLPITMQRWLFRVDKVEQLNSLPLTAEERCEHLPEMISDIAARLRKTRIIEAIASPSTAALEHGRVRCRQGYTPPQMVEESRILQVCIFETIQRNLASVDFSLVLPDIMLIADEVDAQLTQSINSYLGMQRESGAAASA